MARPQKEGLDYFSLDVDMDQDDKVLLIEAKHKITGFAILVKLLMKIYKEGYFYKWTEREQLLFSSRINVDTNTINDVVNDCVKWEFFEPCLYKKYAILTSCGIQKRYIEAIKRRKEITLITEYLIVDPPEQSENLTVNLVNVNINPVNTDINQAGEELIPTIIPKVKNTKVKETKLKYADNVFLLEAEHKALVEKYGLPNTIKMIEKLGAYKLSNGRTYKSDYGAINSWVADKIMGQQGQPDQPKREIRM